MIKKILILFILLTTIYFPTFTYAQLQNASFEDWDNGYPVGWITSEIYDPGTAVQSTDAHSGNFALKLSTYIDSIGDEISPAAIYNFPLTTLPEIFSCWVKGSLNGNNTFRASFDLINADSISDIIAHGENEFIALNNVYQYKFMNILPFTAPSLLGTATIYLTIETNNTNNPNTQPSYIIVDDLYIGPDNSGAAAVNNLGKESHIVEKLYPNPANDIAYLVFNIEHQGAHVSLKVFDLLGNEVQEVFNSNMYKGKYKAEINTSELKRGVYFCKLNINGTIFSAKFVKA
ncbi:MAG: T9SS type A sorting domain-containing protein [Bacteroidia bacterium]|nr:T9SS type A sorting domain-containing protein [Bacteroidia bacterium]MCZ2249489.1 T9SS type A sorting domain-containing protein [Bacteroidia bacterium]